MHTQDGNFVRRYAELAAQDHQVTVLHVTPDPRLHGWVVELKESGEPFGKLLTAYYAGGGARVQRLVNRSRAWKAVRQAYRGTPDLIHAHVLIDGGIVAMRMARQLGIPFVVSCHSSRHLDGETWKDRPLDYWLARRAARRAYCLLPVSNALSTALQNAGMEARYQVVSNVVDIAFFKPPESLSSSGKHQLLHLSDFSSKKRLDVLLVAFDLAFQQESSLRLTIAGNGDPAVVKQLLKAHPETEAAITLCGTLSRREVAREMGKHDLYVLSSEVETQGIVLIEALRCGLPIVTTNCGGPSDLNLSPKDGTIVSVNDPRALAAAILTWVRAGIPTLPEREQRHQRYVNKGAPLQIREQLEKIYQDALASTKPGS